MAKSGVPDFQLVLLFIQNSGFVLAFGAWEVRTTSWLL
jgi:hypothetical protein